MALGLGLDVEDVGAVELLAALDVGEQRRLGGVLQEDRRAVRLARARLLDEVAGLGHVDVAGVGRERAQLVERGDPHERAALAHDERVVGDVAGVRAVITGVRLDLGGAGQRGGVGLAEDAQQPAERRQRLGRQARRELHDLRAAVRSHDELEVHGPVDEPARERDALERGVQRADERPVARLVDDRREDVADPGVDREAAPAVQREQPALDDDAVDEVRVARDELVHDDARRAREELGGVRVRERQRRAVQERRAALVGELGAHDLRARARGEVRVQRGLRREDAQVQGELGRGGGDEVALGDLAGQAPGVVMGAGFIAAS